MDDKLRNQTEEENFNEPIQEEEEWTLDKIERSEYLNKRKPFFADEVYKFGAALAAFLAIAALLANQFGGK